jgi:ATP-binding cassette subfamily B protein
MKSRIRSSAVVHDNIIGFKKNTETVLGERGITLSGGQNKESLLPER